MTHRPTPIRARARARPPRAGSSPSPAATGTRSSAATRPDRTTSGSSSTWARSTRPRTACCGWSSSSRARPSPTPAPVVGYLHTGIEKNLEYRTWTQGITFVTRMDYLAPIFNETAYCLAVEKLLGIEAVPSARPADPRADDGAQPDLLAPGLAGHRRHGARRAHDDDLRLPRARVHPRHLRDDHRPADEHGLRPPGRRRAGPARRRRSRRSASSSTIMPKELDGVRGAAARPADLDRADQGRRPCSTSTGCLALGITGPVLRSAGLPWDLRKTDAVLRLRDLRVRRADRTTRGDCWGRYLVRAGRDARVAEDHRAGAGPARARARSWSTTRRSPGRRSSRSARTAWATRSSTSRRSWASRWSR